MRTNGRCIDSICGLLPKECFELPSTCKTFALRDLIDFNNPDNDTVHMGMSLFSYLDFYENDVIALPCLKDL